MSIYASLPSDISTYVGSLAISDAEFIFNKCLGKKGGQIKRQYMKQTSMRISQNSAAHRTLLTTRI